jgi:FkbM family methyltransferase
MAAAPTVSYAQRFEDIYLMRCFGERSDGFYIDIGAGHPVFDNVSFAFYLRGWRGITVEPNPHLSQLARAVRPRDHHHQAVVGTAPGTARFYIVRDFHGLSTMIASNADAALAQFGKSSEEIEVPATTLAALCERYAPAAIDFLKVDVEGMEEDVLRGGDWRRFRPKIVVVEALAPFSLAPAWESWEPILTGQGYRYVWFDSLNRYYLAEEAAELAPHFSSAPAAFPDVVQFRETRPALADAQHPDHRLAGLLAAAAMTRLPLLDGELLLELLTADIAPAELARVATKADVDTAFVRLFGSPPTEGDGLGTPAQGTVRDLYARIIASDRFRTACGRISASYAW